MNVGYGFHAGRWSCFVWWSVIFIENRCSAATKRKNFLKMAGYARELRPDARCARIARARARPWDTWDIPVWR